jgi:hypothetical protein
VSGQLSFSFSDANAGLHCFGRSGETAVVLSPNGPSSFDSVEVAQVDDRFEIALGAFGETLLEPLGPPVAFRQHQRSDWLCRARATMADGRTLDGFGCVTLAERGLGRLTRRRSIWIYFEDGLALTLLAERASSKPGHDEPVAAFVARGAPLEASPLEDPLVSSTYRADPLTGAGGRLVHAGLELWEGEDAETRERARALRISGETIAAAELTQDGVATSVAFLAWHHRGRRGTGAYLNETVAS